MFEKNKETLLFSINLLLLKKKNSGHDRYQVLFFKNQLSFNDTFFTL